MGHHDPSLQLVKPIQALTVANHFDYLLRDSRIAQPLHPRPPGQRPILCGERVAWSRIDDVGRRHGQSAMQAPCHKQILTIRMKVR